VPLATILIIEDEPTVLSLAESILQHAGYETLSAATLAQAQAIIQSDQHVDLVFTDIALADLTEGGLQVGQITRQAGSNTPVIYTSGMALNDGMKALFVWPYKFLPKPYTDHQLIEAVAKLLRRPAT
jgi:two-component system OmpR family response regulator